MLREGNPESALRESELPVLWQVPDPVPHTGDGGLVIFMDGHTDWRDYPREYPMTEGLNRRGRDLQKGAE